MSKDAVTPILLAIVGGEISNPTVAPRPVDSNKNSNNIQHTHVNVSQTPISPAHTAHTTHSLLAEGLQDCSEASDIDAVAYLKNQITNYNLKLSNNHLQVKLDQSDIPANLIKVVVEGLENNENLWTWFDGFEMEIWVLPQIGGSSKMYCWTKLAGCGAGKFLDAYMAEDFGWESFIEACIVPKPRGRIEDPVPGVSGGKPMTRRTEEEGNDEATNAYIDMVSAPDLDPDDIVSGTWGDKCPERFAKLYTSEGRRSSRTIT